MADLRPLSPICIGSYRFSAPQAWHRAVAPVGAGLYAILVPEVGGLDGYELMSVGESEDLRVAFLHLRNGPLQEIVRRHGPHVQVAWLPIPPGDAHLRQSVEGEIIREFLPELRTYKLFVSHSWGHDEEYNGLVSLLNKAVLHFRWEDLSITVGAPVPPNPALRRSYRSVLLEVEARIRESDCVLVLAGMYGSWSPWMQSEIESAQDNRKPIIGVEPNGQQRVPQEVRSAAWELVGWRSDSIIAAVRRVVT